MNLSKAKLVLGGFFLAVAAITTIAAVGTGTGDNNFHLCGSLTVNNGASQIVTSTRMRQSTCDAWLFTNRDLAETIYINANVVDGYNGDAQVSDVNMLVVEAGQTLELEDALIKQFQVISTGDADLYWIGFCK